jgi:hypothetical protein
MSILREFTGRFARFFTAPISPAPLGVFRISIAAFTLLQAALWYPDWGAFLGEDGWIQWEISKAFNQAWHLHLQDVYGVFQPLGLSSAAFVEAFFWVYALAAAGLLLGWHTRLWAILAWLCHYIMMSTLPTFVYGVDIFLHISLFYMMVMPVGKAYSLDLRQGRAAGGPSWGATLAIRVLQIHLCLVYFSAGFEKMLYAAWWEGDVIWRAVAQPDFRQLDMDWLARYPWLPMLLSWFTMFIETFYFAAMWVPKIRAIWLAGIICLHLGIGIFLGLYLFGLIMILLSLAAFGQEAWQDYRHSNFQRREASKASYSASPRAY